jgi:hypothetical protein
MAFGAGAFRQDVAGSASIEVALTARESSTSRRGGRKAVKGAIELDGAGPS